MVWVANHERIKYNDIIVTKEGLERIQTGMMDFRECEGVIFDLDGTLIDSMWVWDRIDENFLGRRGIAVPEDYLEKITPMGYEACADYTIERFGLKETRQQVMEEWYGMAVDAYSHDVSLKAGVREFLEYLRHHGVKMAIATASSLRLVLPVLKNNEIMDYFDNITTLQEVKRGKGFPDVYDLAAERMKTTSRTSVVFEDIREGIIGAKMGGYTAVGVYEEKSKASMEKIMELSDWFIYDFKECITA